MIKLHFIGNGNVPEQIDLHAGIIKGFSFLNNSLVIEFKRSEKTMPDKKKHMSPGFINWTFTKNVNDITNYPQVLAFLKSLPLNGNVPAAITAVVNTDNQQSLF